MLSAERLPLRAVPAEWVSGMPAVAGLLVVLFVATTSGLPAGEWSRPVIVALIAARMLIPVYVVLTTRVLIDDECVSVRTGIVHRRTASVTWSAARVVQVEEPFAYRLFGLAKASILPAGDGDSTIRLDGIPMTWIDEIRRRHEEAPVSAQRSESQHPGGPERYRASAADLMMTCVAQGRIVLVIGALTFAGYDLLGDLGLLPQVRDQVERNPVLSGSVIGAVLVSGAVIVTVVRYYGLGLEADGDVLRISHGVVDRMQRTITADGLVGIRVRRNLLELLTDRVRISLITTDGVRGLDQNLILPSIPRPRAREAIRIVDPDLAGLQSLATPMTGAVLRSLGRLLLVLVTALGCAWIAFRVVSAPWAAVLAVVVVAAVILGGFRLATMRLGLRNGEIEASWRSAVDSEERLRVTELHGVSILRIGQGGTGLIRVHFFAGRPRRWTAMTTRADVPALEAIACARDRARIRTEERSA